MLVRIITSIFLLLLTFPNQVDALSESDLAAYNKAMYLLDSQDNISDDFRQVEDIMRDLLESHPQSPQALTYQGRILVMKACPDADNCSIEELKKAAALFKKAESSANGFYDAFFYDACSRILADDLKRAQSLVSKTKSLKPNSMRSEYLQGLLSFKQNKLTQAVQSAEKSLRMAETPEDRIRAGLLLAQIHQAEGDLEQAEKNFQTILTANPGSVKTLIAYAHFLLDKKQDPEAAIETARKAFSLAPSSANRMVLASAYSAKAEQLLASGEEPVQAQKFFRLALQEGSDSPAVYRGLGETLIVQGLAEEATDKLMEGEDMLILYLRVTPNSTQEREMLIKAEKARRILQGGFAPKDLPLEKRNELITAVLKKMAIAQELFRQEHGYIADAPEFLVGLAGVDRDEGLSISSQLAIADYYFMAPPRLADQEPDFLIAAFPAVYPQEGRITIVVKTDGRILAKDIGPEPTIKDLKTDEAWVELP